MDQSGKKKKAGTKQYWGKESVLITITCEENALWMQQWWAKPPEDFEHPLDKVCNICLPSSPGWGLDETGMLISAKPVTTRQTPRLSATKSRSSTQYKPGQFSRGRILSKELDSHYWKHCIWWDLSSLHSFGHNPAKGLLQLDTTSLDRTWYPTAFLVYLKGTFLECSYCHTQQPKQTC